MSSAKHHIKLLSFFAVAAMTLAGCATVSAETGDPWTDIPENEIIDWGEMWGTVIQFQYVYDPEVGNQAQTIEWDFGDGSPRSTEWNPRHTYEKLGTYIVVQHVTNTYEGFSEDWGYYRMTIMGKPYVEIVAPEGAPQMEKVYATKGTAPEQPDNPIWKGHEFLGYYADAEFTVPFDWTIPLDRAVTAYAQFQNASVIPDPDDEDPIDDEDPNGTDSKDNKTAGIGEFFEQYGALTLGIAGGIVVAVFAIGVRHPIVLIVGIALLVIAALVHLGVF
jgi:hypothetical protein